VTNAQASRLLQAYAKADPGAVERLKSKALGEIQGKLERLQRDGADCAHCGFRLYLDRDGAEFVIQPQRRLHER